MEKYIYDNSNGLWYELHGDYYIPCLVLPDTEERPLGIWGRRHLDFIKEQRPMLYADLVLSCKLHNYLADIDAQANAELALLIKQMAEKEGVTEQLKEQNQMAWVRTMGSIRNRTEEIVNVEIIFA
ncbi:TnpV protein [Neobittarella massiliensis]|uniref:TnpV protein n=1 Tax=Neobittarella massiliensis (ex Bilen et al. 2018) TaxID=2041842 RepID=UPI000CF65499|nr:TnpV protein [Neobittarella massiliensis]